MKIYVIDTSAIIEGIVSKMIESGEIKEARILVHKASLSELEFQANYGREIGFSGLDELKKLNDISSKNEKITVEFVGERPKEFQIKYAKSGEIDAMIREEALKNGAILITLDKVDA
jgi:ATPase